MDVELIAVITGLPFVGIDPTRFLRKDQENVIETRMKEKYDVTRDNKGFLISSISDHTVRFVAKVLDSKLLHKIRPT